MSSLKPGEKLGIYIIQNQIGAGGMATVYSAASSTDAGQVVAIKVMSEELSVSDQFVKRFERESQLLASLDHPNILPLLGMGQIGKRIYIVMKLANGGTLGERVRAGKLSLADTLRILAKISAALDYAHSQQVIHRDLKPANILLDETGEPYLSDFGIAKFKEESIGLTATGSLVGTPSYMAPEQWRSEPIEASTDIYALGVMVFELLSGQLPFRADNPFSLMYQHLDNPPPPITQIRPDLPASLDRALRRAMAKTPEHRYPSATALIRAIQTTFEEAESENTIIEAPTPPKLRGGVQASEDNTPTTYLDDLTITPAPGQAPQAAQVTADKPADPLANFEDSWEEAHHRYNAVDVGARVLLERAKEAVQELKGDEVVLAESVVNYIQDLREQAKRSPQSAQGPYRALESYDVGDNKLFFGRELAIDALMEKASVARFAVLQAESGAGKTSLLRAGIMPRLLAGGYLPLYVAVRRRLPHESLKSILIPEPSHAPTLAGTSLRAYLKTLSKITGANREIFIFIDQFETLFSDVFTDEQRAAFVQEVAECLDDPVLPVRIMLAMRTEYFGLLASFQPDIAQPFANEFLLRALKPDEAERALILPAMSQGYRYEPLLTQTILHDLTDQSGQVAPPQLQLVGGALIETLPADRKTITLDDYTQAGRAEGVLQGYLERLLNRFPPEQRRIARFVIESLVRADQTRDIRSQKNLEESLSAAGQSSEHLNTVLSTLRENRILRVVDLDEGLAYELVHDYLALQVQLDPETTARKAAQELLDRRVGDFERYGSLLSQQELGVISAQQDRLSISPQAKQMIAQTQAARRQQRRFAIALAAFAVLAVIIALGVGLFALVQDNQNRQERLVVAQTSEAEILAQRDLAELNAATAIAAQDEALLQANIAETQAAIADQNAGTAIAAQDEVLLQANIAETQAALAQQNAATAIVAQDEALIQADNAGTQAAIAVAAQDEALLQANIAETQAAIADQNAATAIAAQDEVLLQANIAETQAALAQQNAATAIVAQDEALIQADNAGTQAAIADQNAAIALTAQNEALLQANIAETQAAIAVAAQDEALLQANIAETQAAIADQNAATATIAQGEALIQADNAGTQAAIAVTAQSEALLQANIAETQAAIAVTAQSEALVQANIAETQAAIAVTAQSEALIQADNAGTQAALADQNAGTAIAAQDEVLLQANIAETQAARADQNAATAVAALTISEESERSARAQALAVSADQLVQFGDTDLALVLALESARLNPDLIQTQGVLSRASSVSPVLVVSDVSETRFQPAQARLLTLNRARTQIGLWEVATREQIYSFEIPADSVRKIEFSNDGAYIVAAMNSGQVLIWDSSSGALRHQINAHEGETLAIAFHPDNQRMASTGRDYQIVLWNLSDGSEASRFRDNTNFIREMVFTPEGNNLISWTTDLQTIMGFWDVNSGRLRYRSQNVYRGFNRDYSLAWSGGKLRSEYPRDPNTGDLTIWQSAAESVQRRITRDFNWRDLYLQFIDFSPNGRFMIIGVQDRAQETPPYMALLDMNNSEILSLHSSLSLYGTNAAVTDAVFSPTDRLIVSTTADYKLMLWNYENGRLIRQIGADDQPQSQLAFDSTGNYLVSLSADNIMRVWSIYNAYDAEMARFENVFAISPDASLVVGADVAFRMYAYNVDDGSTNFYSDGHGDNITAAAFNPMGGFLITGDRSGTLIQWDLSTEREHTRAFAQQGEVSRISFSPSGRYAIVQSAGGASLWDGEARRIVRQAGQSAAISPDESYFVYGERDALITFDLSSNSERQRVTLPLALNQSAIIVGDTGQVAQIESLTDENAAEGEPRLFRLALYDINSAELVVNQELGEVNGFAFSPDGLQLLVGQDDSSVVLYDVTTGAAQRRLIGHSSRATAAAFSPDGFTAMTGDMDGLLILWDITTGQQMRALQDQEGVNAISFSANGRAVLTQRGFREIVDNLRVPLYGTWRIETLAELITWAEENRMIKDLSCVERAQYNLPPLCEADN